MAKKAHKYAHEVGSILASSDQSFRILEPFGVGGTAETYLAEIRNLGRKVVLKVPRKELAHNTVLMDRFCQEARIIARLQHRNIVKVELLCRALDGTPFFVMPYLRGETVHSVLHRLGKVPLLPALEIIIQTGYGLTCAHAAGIAHRDVKPQNIFLKRISATKSIAKILDFGLFKFILLEAPEGMFFGTLCRAAPEQLLGKKNVGEKADIYGLGIMFFELLTGVLPFAHFGTSREDMLKTLSIPMPLLTEFGDFPVKLAALIQRMTDKDPAKRPDILAVVAEARSILSILDPERDSSSTYEEMCKRAREQEVLSSACLEEPTAPIDHINGLVCELFGTTKISVPNHFLPAEEQDTESDLENLTVPLSAVPGTNDVVCLEAPRTAASRILHAPAKSHAPNPDPGIYAPTAAPVQTSPAAVIVSPVIMVGPEPSTGSDHPRGFATPSTQRSARPLGKRRIDPWSPEALELGRVIPSVMASIEMIMKNKK